MRKKYEWRAIQHKIAEAISTGGVSLFVEKKAPVDPSSDQICNQLSSYLIAKSDLSDDERRKMLAHIADFEFEVLGLPRDQDQNEAWPRVTDKPGADDVVAVLMVEEMARKFEERCLGSNTRGSTRLSKPLLFREDDVPTYIIEATGR